MSTDLDPRFRLAASQVLEERASQVAVLSKGVLDVTEIGTAEDLWLATRRLRAALEVFRPCLGRAEYREGKTEARRIARAVGERRDIDVAIRAYEEIGMETAPDDAGGIELVITNLRREQAKSSSSPTIWFIRRALRRMRSASLRLGPSSLPFASMYCAAMFTAPSGMRRSCPKIATNISFASPMSLAYRAIDPASA